MLKVSGIEAARGQDDGIAVTADIIHGLSQQLRVVSIILDVIIDKGLGTASAADIPCNHGIGGAGRNPEIVLQDVPDTVLSLDQINTGNMGVDSLRRGNSFAFYGITGGCVDKLLRDDFILYDFFLPINIIQKEI